MNLERLDDHQNSISDSNHIDILTSVMEAIKGY